jgi:FkbM family methyltransferase
MVAPASRSTYLSIGGAPTKDKGREAVDMRKVLKFLTRPIVGKKRFQAIFELFYEFSLKGMNIGMGRAFRVSGEKWVVDFVERTFRESANPIVMLDAGANDGEHARYALQTFGSAFRVYSCEPMPGAFDKLVANTSGFANATNLNVALGDQAGVAAIYSPTPQSVLASLHQIDFHGYEDKPAVKAFECVVRTLDSICESEGIERIHFLKIDVEGYELNVLKGAERMLQSEAIDVIQFEFGGTINPQLRIFFKDFWDELCDKYSIYRVLQDGLRPIAKYHVKHEQYFCTNFLAIRRGLPHAGI